MFLGTVLKMCTILCTSTYTFSMSLSLSSSQSIDCPDEVIIVTSKTKRKRNSSKSSSKQKTSSKTVEDKSPKAVEDKSPKVISLSLLAASEEKDKIRLAGKHQKQNEAIVKKRIKKTELESLWQMYKECEDKLTNVKTFYWPTRYLPAEYAKIAAKYQLPPDPGKHGTDDEHFEYNIKYLVGKNADYISRFLDFHRSTQELRSKLVATNFKSLSHSFADEESMVAKLNRALKNCERIDKLKTRSYKHFRVKSTLFDKKGIAKVAKGEEFKIKDIPLLVTQYDDLNRYRDSIELYLKESNKYWAKIDSWVPKERMILLDVDPYYLNKYRQLTATATTAITGTNTATGVASANTANNTTSANSTNSAAGANSVNSASSHSNSHCDDDDEVQHVQLKKAKTMSTPLTTLT